MASTSSQCPLTPSASNTTDIHNLKCPFTTCGKEYKGSSKLKQHLRTIRGSGGDSKHPIGDPEWDRLDEVGYLKLHSRPGDLTVEERERRRAEAQRKHYQRNKQVILRRHKERTEQINSALEIAKDVGSYAKSAYTREQKIRHNVKDRSKILQTVFGSSAQYNIHSFIPDLDGHPTLETFPRLVAFYLQQSDFPILSNMIPNVSRIIDYIPGESHFRKVSRILHPDMGNTTNLQSTLAAAFDLWKPILQDKELATALLPSDDDIPEFVARGENYKLLLDLYWFSMTANVQAAQLMSPQMLSLATLYKTLLVLEEEEELLKGDEDDTGADGKNNVESIIQKIMDLPAVNANMRRLGRKRPPRSRSNSGENDSTDSDDLDVTIDPALQNKRQLRPRPRKT